MANTTIYVIDSTDGTTQKRVLIPPLTFNGYGGIQRDTDLTLYGNGAPNWGERFNENFFKLLENFACPEKTGTNPPEPLSETDFQGVDGRGINNPIQGQLWYNTTQERLFLYTGTTWITTVGTLGIADITGLQTELDGKVDRSGDTMTGSLLFNNGSVDFLAFGESEGDVNTAPDIRAATNLSISSGVGTYLLFDTSNSGGIFSVRKGSMITTTATEVFRILNNGILRETTNATSYSSLLSSDQDIPNKKYVDDEILAATGGGGGNLYVLKTGDTMTGGLVLSGNPTSSLHAATKQYVDTRIQRSGDTMTGYLTLNANPTSSLHAATKQYVDSAVSSSIPTGTVVMLDAGYDISVPANANVWNTVTCPVVIPTGATAVILGGTGPYVVYGTSDTAYYFRGGQFIFRKNSAWTPIIQGVATGASINSFGAVTGVFRMATSIVPITASNQFQVQRNYYATGTMNYGTLSVYGYII